ncbi:MAG: hypothetical protein HUU34_09700 [Saprospiraceae bacterium]|jgi:hypothetical protein|nr:hypothetical protein [Saprospiraceae bacterium]
MDGPEILIPLVAIVGFFCTVIFVVFIYFSSRHKERMALLEYGKDVNVFEKRPNRLRLLKQGIVAVMVGAGLLMGNVMTAFGADDEIVYLGMPLLMGGVGLIGFYLFLPRNSHDDVV